MVTNIDKPAYNIAPGRSSYLANFVNESNLPKAAIEGESNVDVIYEVGAAWQADTDVY